MFQPKKYIVVSSPDCREFEGKECALIKVDEIDIRLRYYVYVSNQCYWVKEIKDFNLKSILLYLPQMIQSGKVENVY